MNDPQTPEIVFKTDRCVESFGVMIGVNRHGFAVTADGRAINRLLCVEIYQNGRLIKSELFSSAKGWRDNCRGVNPAECGLRVLDMDGKVVAVLDVEEDPYPFMRPAGEQQHITESYVSVPPALTLTDETGAVWTLGMTAAPKHKSPDGEFAFGVIRNGVDTLEVASRIERRGGKVKIFTCDGWKVWTGKSFF